jgi:hypothetical protein
MPAAVSRRAFVSAASILGLAPIAYGRAQPEAPKPTTNLDHFPRQHPELVREVVGASHRNLERVRELVTQHPALATATWDWGFGDWESALGAASHVGNREIALFLIESGARPDLFAFTMLGDLAAVKAMIEAHPGIQRTKGPHSIPLLAHARAGGDAAKPVYEYLESLKDAGETLKSEPMTDAEMSRLAGKYIGIETASGVSFEIRQDKGALVFQHKPQSAIRLFHVGNGEFHPAGVPHVQISVAAGMNGPARVTIRDHDVILTAVAAS